MTADNSSKQALTRLLQQLSQLCQQQHTGTLIGITEHNESLMIVLQQGNIVGLSFRMTFGMAALPLILAVSYCTFNFKDNLVIHVDADLPPSSDILQALGATPSVGPLLLPQNESLLSPTKPSSNELRSSQAASSLSQVKLSSNDNLQLMNSKLLRDIIELQANKLFGPVASLLLEENFTPNSLTTLDELRKLLRSIAEDAGAPHLIGQFISKVMITTGVEQRVENRS